MNNQDILLINQFIEGVLSEEQLVLYNERIELDEAFREHAKFEIQMHHSLDEANWSFVEDINNEEVLEYKKLLSATKTIELKEILRNIVKENTSKPRKKFKIWYGVAAILLVCISVFSLLNNKDQEDLYAKYLDKSEIPSLAVRSVNQNSLLTIQQLFDEGKYNETLSLISDSTLATSPSKGTLLIIKGISLLETNQNKEALFNFDKLIDSDLLDGPKGYWYKALYYLKIDEPDKCKSVLKQITENNLYNSEKAKELLNEL